MGEILDCLVFVQVPSGKLTWPWTINLEKMEDISAIVMLVYWRVFMETDVTGGT